MSNWLELWIDFLEEEDYMLEERIVQILGGHSRIFKGKVLNWTYTLESH